VRDWLIIVFAWAMAPWLLFGLPSPASGADQWTNLHGTTTVTGDLLGMWNGRVLLRLEGGRRVAVKMEDLRADSRIQAEKLFDQLQQRMRQRGDEIRVIAEEASAPAPKDALARTDTATLGIDAAPAYQAPAADAPLRDTLVAIRDQLFAGHPRVFFDTLPPSHQQSLDQLMKLALAKMDNSALESSRRTLLSTGDLIISRQRWLFSHPRLAALNDQKQAEVLKTAQMLRVLFADDILSVAAIQSRPLAESIAKLDTALSPYLFASLNDPVTGFSMLKPDIDVEPAADGKMIGKLVLPIIGPVFSQTLVAAEGRWAWGESAEAFPVAIKALMTPLEAMPDGAIPLMPTAQLVMGQLDQAVSSLQQAQTRQEFHRKIDELWPQVVVLVNQWSGYKPPQLRGLAGQYGSGTEMSEYDMQMSAEMNAASAEMAPAIGAPTTAPTGPITP